MVKSTEYGSSHDRAKALDHPTNGASLSRAPGDVCTENSILFGCVTESPNVSGDDRSALALPGPVRLAVQVEKPT
jgi:hypothetical protein